MNDQIIKHDLLDNSIEQFILINPTKQQLAFFPKEESQMFQGKSYDNLGTRPTGYENDPETETENNNTKAFVNNIKSKDIDPFQIEPANKWANFDTLKIPFVQNTIVTQGMLQKYKYGIDDINSSHTATDYIGATNINIPFIIDEIYADFKFLTESSSSFTDIYSTDDSDQKLNTILNGIQRIRIPINIFNTILTDSALIANNGGDNVVRNYGKYYVFITPKYIQSNVTSIDKKEHFPTRYMSDNAIDESIYNDINLSANEIHIEPNKKRRTIYHLDKTDFINTNWNFETNPRQSGRLFGSVVEIWDSSNTQLKQIKIMTENQFNFNDINKAFECVLQPDIFGYDVDIQDINVGDILRIYPRETYFNNVLIEVDYKNKNIEISNLISFLTNDSVRDMSTGIFEVYDDAGFTIDDTGNFNGNIIRRYQIFQKDKFEARKTLK